MTSLSTPSGIIAAVQADALIPVAIWYDGGFLSYSSLSKYRKLGLRTEYLCGRQCLRPSELKRFEIERAKPYALDAQKLKSRRDASKKAAASRTRMAEARKAYLDDKERGQVAV